MEGEEGGKEGNIGEKASLKDRDQNNEISFF